MTPPIRILGLALGALLASGGAAQAADDDARRGPARQAPGFQGPDIVLFNYSGGPQPTNVTVVDGDPNAVEFGVPRSRMFDATSPLDGSLADTPGGGPQTFPGPDDPNDTGMLIKLGSYQADPNDARADRVVICIDIELPPTPPTYRWVKCSAMRSSSFDLDSVALDVFNNGGRNYFHMQSRRLPLTATSRDPDDADPADRLVRAVQPLDSTTYDPLTDGTGYESEVMEMTMKLEVVPGMPGKTITIYVVIEGGGMDGMAQFYTDLSIIMSDVPDPGSPFVGNPYDDYAIVYERVHDRGPVEVVRLEGPAGAAQYVPSGTNVGDPDNANPQNGVLVQNPGGVLFAANEPVQVGVPTHPELNLELDREVFFDDFPQRNGLTTGVGTLGTNTQFGFFVPWQRLGKPTAGSLGEPELLGVGTLTGLNSPMAWRLTEARPFSVATLVIGITQIDASFKGGVLVPSPEFLIPGLPVNSDGNLQITAFWPGLPQGATLFHQMWIQDGQGPVGFAASNGLRSIAP